MNELTEKDRFWLKIGFYLLAAGLSFIIVGAAGVLVYAANLSR